MGDKMGGGPAATCNAMEVQPPCHPQAQPRGPLWGPPGQGSWAAALWPHGWMAGSEGLSLRSAPRDRGVREKEPGHRPWRCGPCSQGPRREGSGGLGGAQDGRRLRPSPSLRACCGHWATSGGSLPRRQGRPLAGQHSGAQHRGDRTVRPRAMCLPPRPLAPNQDGTLCPASSRRNRAEAQKWGGGAREGSPGPGVAGGGPLTAGKRAPGPPHAAHRRRRGRPALAVGGWSFRGEGPSLRGGHHRAQ